LNRLEKGGPRNDIVLGDLEELVQNVLDVLGVPLEANEGELLVQVEVVLGGRDLDRRRLLGTLGNLIRQKSIMS
jgi:hypothetical protein